MEEEIKEEERSADEAGKHGNNAVVVDIDDPPWVKYMEAKLAFKSKHCQRSHPFTICKVPRDIREVDSVAHDPLVVSIGPYHRGNKNLLDMEQVKWRNLNAFRGRPGKGFNEYLKVIKEIEPRARDCYSGNIDMDADEFIEMMLLDGLFMIKLFSTDSDILKEEEPIYTISGMLCRVGSDMLLLENQLPFFVLERIWNAVFTDQEGSKFALSRRAFTFIQSCMPLSLLWDRHERVKNPAEMINEDGVHHLLHLVYLLLKPDKQPKPKGHSFISRLISKTLLYHSSRSSFIREILSCLSIISRFIKEILSYLSIISRFIKKILSHLSFIYRFIKKILSSLSFIYRFIKQIISYLSCLCPSSFIYRFIKKILSYLSCLCPSLPIDGQMVIASAVELDQAGVVFKCVKAKSFFDVKFEGGTMEMPRLVVEDSTKPLLRNFIAYEQCFPEQGDHITSYCSFMDDLVNTRRDVEILKKSNIIENWLGSDKEVALLFNDLGKGIFVSDFEDRYHGELWKQVAKHTQKPWPKWQAKLNHDYFSNPWAIISVLAATFVIILTAVQTYYAVVA